MKHLKYQMDHALYQILTFILRKLQKKYGTFTDPLIRIYVNKKENSITFRIKKGFNLNFLTPETTTLLGSTKGKITKDKNGKSMPHLEINEVLLVDCNIVNNDYQQDSRVLCTFVGNKSFGQLLDISLKNYKF